MNAGRTEPRTTSAAQPLPVSRRYDLRKTPYELGRRPEGASTAGTSDEFDLDG
jgi:hypothetical protein